MKNNYKGLLFLLVVMLSITACKDELGWEYPYLFRPINFNAELNKTEVTLSWAEVTDADSYTLQVSVDSLNYSELVVDTVITGTSFKQDFEGKTDFKARIRANANDSTKNSQFNEVKFKTPSENILILNQVLVNAQKTVQVAWEAARTVTHLELESNGIIETFNVSSEEALAGLKSCVVANNNENYTVRIYNGRVLRGTTKLKVEGDVFLNAGDNVRDAIAAATGNFYVIILQPGEYSITSSAICPTGTSLVVKGADPVNRSVVNIQANTVVLTLPTTADSIIVKNIDFNAVTPSNTAYFINQSLAASVNKLMLDGCNFTGFGNNILRIQNATGDKLISNFIVNNTKVTNCGNGTVAAPSNGSYAFVNCNVDNGHVTNIDIKNSTFNTVSHSLLSLPGQATATTNVCSKINIENCTFYNIVGGLTSTRYLIDGGAGANVSIDITLKNLIFGKTMATNTPGGIRKASGILEVTNVFTTSDWGASVVIPGATSYSGTASALWTDPDNGVFTFKDAAFSGKATAGDPRWK